MKIAFIVPTLAEYKIVHSIAGKFFPVFFTGMGKLRAFKCAVPSSYSSLILTGFCGGVRGLDVGDVVTANKTIEGDFDAGNLEKKKHEIDLPLLYLRNAKICPIVCQDKILKKDEYPWIEDKILATDMESYGAAFGRPSLYVVKVVSDKVNLDSERDFMIATVNLKRKLQGVIEEILEVT